MKWYEWAIIGLIALGILSKKEEIPAPVTPPLVEIPAEVTPAPEEIITIPEVKEAIQEEVEIRKELEPEKPVEQIEQEVKTEITQEATQVTYKTPSEVIEEQLGIPEKEQWTYPAQSQVTMSAIALLKSYLSASKTTKYESAKRVYESWASKQAVRAKSLLRSPQTTPTERAKLQEQYGDILAQAPKPRVQIVRPIGQEPYVIVDGYYQGTLSDPETAKRVEELGGSLEEAWIQYG